MANISKIVTKIKNREYEFSKHSVDQSIFRNIKVSEIEYALTHNPELIEDYSDDKYGPSCLILGYSLKGRPFHIQCSYLSRDLVKIITLYQPDPQFWIDDKIRKSK